jgi:hypothetical protein
LLLWLIDSDVFQVPQLHKHFNVSGYITTTMLTKFIGIILLIPFFGSCQTDYKINSDAIKIEKRLFSPDSQYVALTFYKDNGAMGQSAPITSVVKVTDTLGILTNHTLPCFDLPSYSCYYPDKWLANRTLQVFLNERPFVKEGIPFNAADFELNGIRLKVVPYDYSYQNSPLIEHFSFSPDKKRLLVAYRYRGVSELNISVLNYGDPLPRIGNIFTNTEISWNPIVFAGWNGQGVDMVLKDAEMYKQSDYLNRNVKLPIRFVDVSDYAEKLQSSEHWMNSMLYNDSFVEKLLNEKGKETEAKIVNAFWRKPEGQSLFYYEYEYTVNERTYRSYFRIFKEFNQGQDFKDGDSIKVIYDPLQPLIHKTADKYSR